MSNMRGGVLGAVVGFLFQAGRYVMDIPAGAALDISGAMGSGAAGAVFGGIGGVLVAMVIRAVSR